MTGLEQLVVWLFGIFCVSATVGSAVKAWAQGRVDATTAQARAYVDAQRIIFEAQYGPTTVPDWMAKGGES